MRPNIDKGRYTEPRDEQQLFECECGCKQQVSLYTDEDGDVWMHVISFVPSFWQFVKWWWFERKIYRADLQVRRDDVMAMRNQLNRHLDILDENVARQNTQEQARTD